MHERSVSRRTAYGFTLIEMVVVVIAIGILAGFALDRLLPLVGRAERIGFLQVQADLQSALLLEAADLITRGRSAELPDIASRNPMTLLLRAPRNYLGSQRPADPDDIAGDSWYYDEHLRRLVYRVGKYTRFDALDGPAGRVEFRVALVYDDRDEDSGFDPAKDRFEGLRLEPMRPYLWPDGEAER